jgi:hypothetical protein
MKKLISTFLILSVYLNTYSQNQMTVEGFKFMQNGKTYSLKEAHTLMQNNTNANQTMWEARSKRSNSRILAGFAAVGVGIPVYSVIKNNSISWFFTRYTIPLMLGGITCGVVSIKANGKAKKYATEAVGIYNQSTKTSYHQQPKSEVMLGVVGDGLGVQIKF